MNAYETPKIEIIALLSADILTTSDGHGGGGGDDLDSVGKGDF